MEKRFMVELCLKACRKRLSSQTGFVHLNYENPENNAYTIPTFENFCYALGLFRSRLCEDIAEGKALLQRLLEFSWEGNFPVYLHEFPECRSRNLSLEILPILTHIQRQFSCILGDALKEKLSVTLQRVQGFIDAEKARFPFHATLSSSCLAKQLIAAQLEGGKVDGLSEFWHRGLALYIGPQKKELFFGAYPAPTLYDLFMAEWSGLFPDRLKADHPVHIQASLVMPFQEPLLQIDHEIPYIVGGTIFWGDANKPYSLQIDPKKASYSQEGGVYTFKLFEEPKEESEAEFGFFLNLDPDHAVTIEGEKATTFRLGEKIEITTRGKQIATLEFNLVGGGGQFFGHISRSNRPRQTACYGAKSFDAFDLYLSLRTVARSSTCSVAVKVGLSQASPMACIPLST